MISSIYSIIEYIPNYVRTNTFTRQYIQYIYINISAKKWQILMWCLWRARWFLIKSRCAKPVAPHELHFDDSSRVLNFNSLYARISSSIRGSRARTHIKDEHSACGHVHMSNSRLFEYVNIILQRAHINAYWNDDWRSITKHATRKCIYSRAPLYIWAATNRRRRRHIGWHHVVSGHLIGQTI